MIPYWILQRLIIYLPNAFLKNISYTNMFSGRVLKSVRTRDKNAIEIPSTHYNDVIMSVIASQITGVSIVYSAVCSGADKKHRNSASLAFVVTGEFPAQRASNAEMFLLMTSSCILTDFSVFYTIGYRLYVDV